MPSMHAVARMVARPGRQASPVRCPLLPTMASLSASSLPPVIRSAQDLGTTSPPRRLDSVRLYALRDSSAEFIAELGRTDPTHDAVIVREEPPVGSEERGELLLAVLRNGKPCGFATLVADASRQVKFESDEDEEDESEDEDAEEEGEKQQQQQYESEDEDAEDSEGEKQQQQLDLCATDESSSGKDSEIEAKEEDAYEEEGDGWLAWEDNYVENQEKKSQPAYSLKIRVWPGYANIVLFDGLAWISTTSYNLTWLSNTESEILMEKLARLSQFDIKGGDSPFVLEQDVVSLRSEYEGELVNSWAVQMFIQHNLKPSFYDFKDQKLLGKGAYCNVRLCTSRYDKKDYAIKIIKIDKYDPAEPREVGILSSLRSHYVVKFLQAWTETHLFVDYEECSDKEVDSRDSRKSGKRRTEMQQPKYVLIHMELCSGTLQHYMSTKTRKFDAQNLRIFKEMVRGLQYIHGENVIHRDLKPANIFMGKDGRIKLGDFGQSCVRPMHVGAFKGTPSLGTPYYEAPELREAENISEKVDVYSLGATYLELYNNFKTMIEKDQAIKTIMNDDGTSTDFEGDLFLLTKMIALDPCERPSADDLVEYISEL